MTTEEDGNTQDGTPPERFAPELEKARRDDIGVNCAVGPAPMLETIERMEAVTRVRLSAQPNAGKPRDVEGRNIYLCSPSTWRRTPGGSSCTTCGWSVAAAGRRRSTSSRSKRRSGPAPPRTPTRRPAAADAARAGERLDRGAADSARSEIGLAGEISRGRFVVGVELLPPRGFEADLAIQRARELKRYGVDFVNIPDGQRAGARLSALSLAVLIEQQAHIETLLHYSCRDRNLLGIQSDLLAPTPWGSGSPADYWRPGARGGLSGCHRRVRRRFDRADERGHAVQPRQRHGWQPIGAPTGFHIGVSVNPAASNLDEELRRFDYKVEAGAEFVLTRPVFDLANFERFLTRIEHARLPVIAGIFPFESARNAEFMANEVPGVHVPEPLMERMRKADGQAAAAAEGIRIAKEMQGDCGRASRGFRFDAVWQYRCSAGGD